MSLVVGEGKYLLVTGIMLVVIVLEALAIDFECAGKFTPNFDGTMRENFYHFIRAIPTGLQLFRKKAKAGIEQ